METAHELFVHELGDMLDAERQLVEALGEQAGESNRRAVDPIRPSLILFHPR